jgi:hypothetical protein
MRWFNDHMEDGVSCATLARTVAGFSLSGPKSRAVIEKLTEDAGRRAALHGLRRVRHRPDALQGRADVGLGRAGLRDPLPDGRPHLAARGAAGGGRERGHHRIRVQRAPVAAAGEKLRHLVAEFTQGYTAGATGMDRWINWDKGDFIGKSGGAGRTRRQRPGAEGRDAGGRRHRRRCQRVRAGLEGRQARGLRHLGRLRAHGGQVAGHGDGQHRPDGAGDGPERAYRRRGACGARHPALAL